MTFADAWATGFIAATNIIEEVRKVTVGFFNFLNTVGTNVADWVFDFAFGAAFIDGAVAIAIDFVTC